MRMKAQCNNSAYMDEIHACQMGNFINGNNSRMWSYCNMVYMLDIILGIVFTIIMYDINGNIVSSYIRMIVVWVATVPMILHRISKSLIVNVWTYYMGIFIMVILECYINNRFETNSFRSDLSTCFPVYVVILYLNEDIREIFLYHVVRICVKISIIFEQNTTSKIGNGIRRSLKLLFPHKKHFKQYSIKELSLIGYIKHIKCILKYGCSIKSRLIINIHPNNREISEKEQLIKECESTITALINRNGVINNYCIQFANKVIEIVGYDNVILVEGGSTSMQKADRALSQLDDFQMKDTDLVFLKKEGHTVTAAQIQEIGHELSNLGQIVDRLTPSKVKIYINSKEQSYEFNKIEQRNTRIIENDISGDKITASVGSITRSINEYCTNIKISNETEFELFRTKISYYCAALNITIHAEILDISTPKTKYGECDLLKRKWEEIQTYFNDESQYIKIMDNRNVLIPTLYMKLKDYYRMLSPEYERRITEARKQQLEIRVYHIRKILKIKDPRLWKQCEAGGCAKVVNVYQGQSKRYCQQHRHQNV